MFEPGAVQATAAVLAELGIDLSRAMVARLRDKPFRYVWPAELDLMARLAGMRLPDRWEGWDRRPFTGESSQHVSVREKPAR